MEDTSSACHYTCPDCGFFSCDESAYAEPCYEVLQLARGDSDLLDGCNDSLDRHWLGSL